MIPAAKADTREDFLVSVLGLVGGIFAETVP